MYNLFLEDMAIIVWQKMFLIVQITIQFKYQNPTSHGGN